MITTETNMMREKNKTLISEFRSATLQENALAMEAVDHHVISLSPAATKRADAWIKEAISMEAVPTSNRKVKESETQL